MSPKYLKARMWKAFIDKMLIEGKPGEEPTEPVNLLGSVESHRKLFMEIELPAVSCHCGTDGCGGSCRWESL
jgi:hypothetical protein